MTSETLAHLIGRLEADPLWRLALDADPWQALACYALLRGSEEPRLAPFGPSEVTVGPGRHPARVRQDRAA